jgi:beta-lactamase class A
MTVLDAVDRKEMDLDEGVMLWPEDRSVFFQPITSRIGERGYPTTLRELIEHGLIESDNAANDKLISQLGGVEKVDAAIRAKDLGGVNIGADEKRLQSAVAGMEWREDLGVTSTFKAERAKLDPAIRDKALQDYLAAPPDGASPVGIVKALAALKRGELLSRESTSFMLATMSLARTGPRRLAGGLPEGWAIAHKTGTGQDWRGASAGINDVGLLTAPDGHVYAVAVMIRRTFQPVPVRLAMMQSVSRAVVETWSAGQPQTTIAGAPELSANTALAR